MVGAIFLLGSLLALVLVIWSIVKPATMPWYGSVLVLCLMELVRSILVLAH